MGRRSRNGRRPSRSARLGGEGLGHVDRIGRRDGLDPCRPAGFRFQCARLGPVQRLPEPRHAGASWCPRRRPPAHPGRADAGGTGLSARSSANSRRRDREVLRPPGRSQARSWGAGRTAHRPGARDTKRGAEIAQCGCEQRSGAVVSLEQSGRCSRRRGVPSSALHRRCAFVDTGRQRKQDSQLRSRSRFTVAWSSGVRVSACNSSSR